MRVGFVGTGNMGSRMAGRLLDAGHALTVYDVRAEAAQALLSRGGQWAGTPREVGESSEVLFASLPGPRQVEEAILEPRHGVLAGLRPGSGFIDTTTSSPTLSRNIAEECRARGIAALDAPVSGGTPGAIAGTLSIMVGGEAHDLERFRPLLECLGQHIFHMGGAGAGMVAKLANQYLVYSNVIVAAEALLMGAKAGVDLDTLAAVLSVSGGSSRMLEHFPRIIFQRKFSGGGALSLNGAIKDVTLAHELAGEVGSPAQIIEIVKDVMGRGREQGLGDLGFHAFVQVLEGMAGVELRS